MGKQLAVTVSAVHRVGTKMYLTDANLTHRKVKKAYLTNGGVYRLCYKGGADVSALVISYTGSMIDAGIVTMADGEYRLLTLTSSGTLKVDEEVSAEYWMCGGGADGAKGGANFSYGYGGAGAYALNGVVNLSGNMPAVVASSGGASAFAGITTNTVSGRDGGTGGGLAISINTSHVGKGDGIGKYPFNDISYFQPHCGGGGAGGYYTTNTSALAHGGAGGTNGGDGKVANRVTSGTLMSGGAGGEVGGGAGGNAGSLSTQMKVGSAASFYGSGGGGGGYRATGTVSSKSGGSGYQGVIYIRIPVNQ